jgi:hypothetical protein
MATCDLLLTQALFTPANTACLKVVILPKCCVAGRIYTAAHLGFMLSMAPLFVIRACILSDAREFTSLAPGMHMSAALHPRGNISKVRTVESIALFAIRLRRIPEQISYYRSHGIM